MTLTAAAPASAQPRRKAPATIAGTWRVETSPHRLSGCTIRGDATITQTGANDYDVRLKVDETCPDGDVFQADEQCRAVVTAPRVAIQCVVVRAPGDNYLADNFVLDMRGGDLMIGRLMDAGTWNEPVTWRRAAPPMVS